MATYIGCSGFHYREWKGVFYPADIPMSKWLQHYTEHFNTIEINATFYKTPTVKSLSKWYKDTPDDFVFTVKANKLFTHYRRMNNVEEHLIQFNGIVQEALREKVKCVLFQFPASVKYTEEMLERVMQLEHSPFLIAVEFRHISWWKGDIYKVFRKAGMIFCNISLPDFPDKFVTNKEANYLRFHGKPILYKSGYGEEGLKWWADKVKKHPSEDLIVYFNNTWFVEAIKDARDFRRMITTDI